MNRFNQIWSCFLVLGLAVTLGLVPVATAQEVNDPVAVANAYIAALGHPDVQINLVTDDVTLRIVPPPPGTPGVWSGKEQAASFLAFTKSQDPHAVLVGSWQVSGDSVTGTVMVTTNDFLKYNVGAVKHMYEFVVQDGKIKSFTSTMDPAERPRVAAAVQAYAAEHPAPVAPGMPTTGAPLAMMPLIFALGLLLLTLGLGFRRRDAQGR